MPYMKNGQFYAATTAHGYADRADGRKVIPDGNGYRLDPPLPPAVPVKKKRKAVKRITVSKHESAMLKLKSDHYHESVELRLKIAQLEIAVRVANLCEAARKDTVNHLLRNVKAANQNLFYAHNNVKVGNLEAANVYLREARIDLNL